MTRTLYRLFKGTLAIAVVAIIAAAVLSAAARLLLPQADGLRETLVARLSETLGVQVEVGALSVRLRGLSPELRFSDARLLAPPTETGRSDAHSRQLLLAAEALRIDLDLLASLAARKPRIDAVGLVGADIRAQRDADGRIRILGLDSMQANDARALTFFLSEGRFRLIDSRLSWRDLSGATPTQILLIEVAELVNRGEHHDLRLRARALADSSSRFQIGSLRILGKLEGPAKHPERWSGQLYLKADGGDLAAVAAALLPARLDLGSDAFRVESWNRLDEGRLTESLTEVGVDALELRVDDEREPAQVGDLSARALWRQQTDGWQLHLDDLRLPGASASEATAARLGYRRPHEQPERPEQPDGGAEQASVAHLFATIGAVQIGPLAEVVAAVAPDLPEAMVKLGQGRIQGLARGLALHLELAADATDSAPLAIGDWRLQGAIMDLAIAAGSGIPPFSGLDLWLDLGPAGGQAHVQGRGASLDLQPLFSRAHRFTALEAEVAWRLMPAGSIHLWTQALRADTANLESLTRLSLCVHPSGANPFINLHTHLRHGRIEALPNWLPVGIMDERLEDWLLQAIVAGKLESGDLLLRGPLERFPFDDKEGRFLLELRAVEGVLDYGVAAKPPPSAAGMRSADESERLQWPPLQDIAATIRFQDRSLEIDVPSATILNSQVDAGLASMPDLWNPRYLEIQTRGEGPLADGIHVLATTPLARQLGGVAASAEVGGRGGIALQLGVPLNRELPFRYSGELTWEPMTGASADRDAASLDGETEDRRLNIKGTELQFTDITGHLRFDENGIDADDIQAKLGQQALEVTVATLDEGSAEARTEIELRGETTVDRLAKTLPSALWQLADGQLGWRLGLTLRNRDAAQQPPPIDFSLSSNLEGLALSLPAPIGKPAREPRRFRLDGRYQDRWPLELRAEYAQLGALIEVDRKPDRSIVLERLAIDLNGQPAALPPARSIAIGGALESLDLGPWLEWIASTNLSALQPGDEGGRLQLLPVRAQVEDLHFRALQLSDLNAVLTPEPGGRWDVQFNAKQSGQCEIKLPAAGSAEPLRIRMERLDLAPLADAASQDARKTPAPPREDPRTIGRIDLDIEQLHYGEDLLGRLRMLSEPQANGVRFETLSLQGPHVDATGRGAWLIDATDYVESSIELDAKSSAIGELLRESGFYSALSGAPSELELQLSWPGGPGDLSLARARGTLTVEVDSGRILDLEPGVGRMLGILNTAALSRRLSLDFSDVFDDGFTFDRIQGDIAIGSGDARIRNLSIEAPAADIKITGRTDLVAGVLDQSVEVTPEIGVGLALAGTVAGGPVVGAAVFLADKVTDGAVERLGRYTYQVRGPWRDPEIRRVDTGGSPSVGNLFVNDRESPSQEAPSTEDEAPTTPGRPPSPFLDDF